MNRKIWIVGIVIILLLVCLTGCKNIVEEMPEQDSLMLETWRAVRANDLETLDRLKSPDMIFDQETCDQINDYVKGEYKKSERLGFHLNIHEGFNNGKSTQWSNQYRVTTDQDVYIVYMTSISINDGPTSVIQFYVINQDEYNQANKIYHFPTMNGMQYGFFAYYILQWLFAAFCIFICIKSKIRMKWLWIIIIVLGFCGITYSLSSNGFSFNFMLLGFPRAYLKVFASKTISLTLPVGGLVFLLIRKSLIKARERYEAKKLLETKQESEKDVIEA